MNDPLLEYYETELRHFRQLSAEFRDLHPGVAGQLALRDSGSADPHVERLIQAFAFLTARVRSKLDDEFPELTEAIFNVLYPHYLAPIPSMAVVQLVVDPGRAQLPQGFLLPPGAKLSRSLEYEAGRRINLQFRTTYPTTLWPVKVESAVAQGPPFREPLRPPDRTAGAIRLVLNCPGELTFDQLELESLRFFLHGDRPLVSQLYEILFNHVIQVGFLPRDRNAGSAFVLEPGRCLRAVGFDRDEGMLPYPNQSFLGYRLLTEFFAFPAKFWFMDLQGLEKLRAARFGRSVEVVFYLNKTLPAIEQGVRTETFRLGCTPIVNLFEPPPATITLTHRQHEYHLLPDVTHRKGVEVYSVDDVKSHNALTGETKTYLPFYSFRHGGKQTNEATFWYATRQAARLVGKPGWVQDGDRTNDAASQGLTGSEVFLHLTDLQFNPRLPPAETLLARTTCTNRDLPALLRMVGEDLVFELEAGAPLMTTTAIRSMTVPTLPLRPPLQRGRYWRLLSHLNLNHLSLTDPVEGREAFQELLRLYDFSDEGVEDEQSAMTKDLIEGITAVSSRRVVGRTGGPVSSGFARGVEVTMEFNEDKCFGTSVLLFASVLERFLGLYASLNSFSQLVAKKAKKEGAYKTWPPRAGEQPLL